MFLYQMIQHNLKFNNDVITMVEMKKNMEEEITSLHMKNETWKLVDKGKTICKVQVGFWNKTLS
jgi:hypothetical protein